MAHQLLEAPIELAILADEDRLHRRLHVVVDAALRHALEELERALVRVEHHLLALAHVRPHERHPAVAQADLRHLHGHRHAVEHDDLVAPVELVSFARCKAQRHISRRHPLALAHRPCLRVAPNVVVAALVAGQTQLLEHPLVGQTLALGPVHVRREHHLQRRHERAQLRQRLLFANVLALRDLAATGAGPNDVANRVARQLQLARNRLDLPALNEIRPPNPAHRVHSDHPRQTFCATHAHQVICTDKGWGQNCSPITPEQGSKLHASFGLLAKINPSWTILSC